MLKVTQLIGFGASSLARPRFTGFYEDAANLSSYSFTNCDIGTPASNRVVVVCVTQNNPRSWGGGVPSVVINGVTATIAVQGGNSNRPAGIWYASVSTGSTGVTITVNPGGTNTGQNCVIGVYAIYPSSATPVDALADSTAGGGTSLTLTDLAKTAGGVAIFVTHTTTTGLTNTVTFTGETIVKDRENTSFGGISYSFQSTMNVASTSTTDDPVATWSSTASERAFAGATWA